MSGVAERAAAAALRVDLQIIADMIPEGARVLDVGCEDGALLAHLVRGKNVDGRGVELSQAGVNVCVSNGLSVIQGDADTDLGATRPTFSTSSSSARPCRPPATRKACWPTLSGSAGARSSASRISDIGGCAGIS